MNHTDDSDNYFYFNRTDLDNISDLSLDVSSSPFKPDYLAIPMLILSLSFTFFQHAYHNSLSSNEKNIVVFLDIGIAHYVQAANIIFLTPVIWRTFISVIPVNVAVLIDICGRCCNFNSLSNYTCLSILRILLYHEVTISTNTDQKKLSRGIFCFSFFFWVGTNFRMFATKRHRQFGYFQYLTKEELASPAINLGGTVMLVLNTIFMISVEMYLLVKLRRWPSLCQGGKLKSVSVAIISMIVTIILGTTTAYFPELNSIRLPLLPFTFQMFFIIKIYSFVIDKLKRYWNIFVSIVSFKGFPESLDNESRVNCESSSFAVNSYGIFVGPNPLPKTTTNEGLKLVSNNFSSVHHMFSEGNKKENNDFMGIYVGPQDIDGDSINEISNEEKSGEDGDIFMKAEFSENEIDSIHDDLCDMKSCDQIIDKYKIDFDKTERKVCFILPNQVHIELSGNERSDASNNPTEHFINEINKNVEVKNARKKKKLLKTSNMTKKPTIIKNGKESIKTISDLYEECKDNEEIINHEEKQEISGHKGKD